MTSNQTYEQIKNAAVYLCDQNFDREDLVYHCELLIMNHLEWREEIEAALEYAIKQ